MPDNPIAAVFGPFLRGAGHHTALTSDGRVLSERAPGLRLAVTLAERDAAGYADEIIKLMKPFCVRFDVKRVKAELSAYGSGDRAGERLSGQNSARSDQLNLGR